MKAQITVVSVNLHPRTRGSITLNDNDPYDAPIIDYQMLSDPRDIKVIVAGLRKMVNLLKHDSLKKYGLKYYRAETPACSSIEWLTDEYFECLVQHITLIVFHPTSTCRMGPDPFNSVVDPELRVHGVHNLRVIDASIMPHVTSGNTNAPTIMIGEKGADLVKKAHDLI